MSIRKVKAFYRKQRELAWQYMEVTKKWRKLRRQKKKYWILAGTPLHGNLGDHAITLAQLKLLKEIDSDREILEIPLLSLLYRYRIFRKIVGKEKILINGGGFMGSLWMKDETMLRKVIETYKDNDIIIFPQTIFFEKGKNEEYVKSKQIYSSHKNLYICTREKKSYSLACKMINKNHVYLVPDMVPYLTYNVKHIPKKKEVLLCLRGDKEKVLLDTEKTRICNILKKKFHRSVKETDTVVGYYVSRETRGKEVRKKIEQFAAAELIITDRLHGMVFAAIAGTPCIAVTNCNYKVEGVYEWIKNNKYIRYIDNLSQIDSLIGEMLEQGHVSYDNGPLQGEYEKIKQLISVHNH